MFGSPLAVMTRRGLLGFTLFAFWYSFPIQYPTSPNGCMRRQRSKRLLQGVSAVASPMIVLEIQQQSRFCFFLVQFLVVCKDATAFTTTYQYVQLDAFESVGTAPKIEALSVWQGGIDSDAVDHERKDKRSCRCRVAAVGSCSKLANTDSRDVGRSPLNAA